MESENVLTNGKRAFISALNAFSQETIKKAAENFISYTL